MSLRSSPPSSAPSSLSPSAVDFFTFLPLAPLEGTSRTPTCSSCSRRVRRRYHRLYACTCTPPGVLVRRCFAVFLSSRPSRTERRTSEGSRHPEESGARTRRRGGQQATDEMRDGEGSGRWTQGNGERQTGRGGEGITRRGEESGIRGVRCVHEEIGTKVKRRRRWQPRSIGNAR